MKIASLQAARLSAFALVLAGSVLVVGCSSGSVNTTPVASATSAPVTQSIPTGAGSLNVASSSSQVASIAFSAGAPAGVQLTATSSQSAPASAPVVSSLKRNIEAISGAVPFFYVTFSVSANLSAQFLQSESVNLTSAQPANAQYFGEFDDITSSPSSKLGTVGPATISGSIATIANGIAAAGAPTLTPGHTYLIQFYYIPASSASSPAPSASATATATPRTQFDSQTATATLNAAGGTLTMPSLAGATYTGSIPYGTIDSGTPVSVSITSANFRDGITPAPPLPSGATTLYLIVTVKNTSAINMNFTGAASQMTFQVPNLANGSVVKAHVFEDPTNQGYVDIGNYPTTFTSVNGSVTVPTPLKLPTCTTGCGNSNPGPNPFFPNDTVMIMLTN